jgi:CheY-like chemotaxis protein
MNLMTNAAEAQPKGGKIRISTWNRYIDRPVKGYNEVVEGDYAVLSVADRGTGIAPEDLKRVFEPFYTKKVMGRSGTGLGMAVVWGTVKDHNGYIQVISSEGEGTRFDLYFPATREKLPKMESLISMAGYMGQGESILIIDDILEQREIASKMLTKLGYRVDTATSGEEALEFLEKNKVDLLVLDMIMDPGMDGLDTFDKIIARHPGQKAVIASGYSETDRVRQAQKLGAGAYIKKPYTLEKLGMAIKQELGS